MTRAIDGVFAFRSLRGWSSLKIDHGIIMIMWNLTFSFWAQAKSTMYGMQFFDRFLFWIGLKVRHLT